MEEDKILETVEMRCDFKNCRRPAHVEVYPMNGTWNYLCKKHYKEEYKKHGDEYGWYELTKWEKIVSFIRPQWFWFWV